MVDENGPFVAFQTPGPNWVRNLKYNEQPDFLHDRIAKQGTDHPQWAVYREGCGNCTSLRILGPLCVDYSGVTRCRHPRLQ
jgi:hypothetical protein